MTPQVGMTVWLRGPHPGTAAHGYPTDYFGIRGDYGEVIAVYATCAACHASSGIYPDGTACGGGSVGIVFERFQGRSAPLNWNVEWWHHPDNLRGPVCRRRERR